MKYKIEKFQEKFWIFGILVLLVLERVELAHFFDSNF